MNTPSAMIFDPSSGGRWSFRAILLAAGVAVILLGALVDIAQFVERQRADTEARVESGIRVGVSLEEEVYIGPPEFIESSTGTAIPVPTTYTVQPGDFLYDIALSNGATTEDLIELNAIVDPTRIEVGQVLALPHPVSRR